MLLLVQSLTEEYESLTFMRPPCWWWCLGISAYTVLCNYTNFRTSYLRIDGIGYTVYPSEYICTVKELTAWFRTRFPRQVVSILNWLLYYSFLSPQQLRNLEEILEKLRSHIRDVSFHIYYRKSLKVIDALSSILWGILLRTVSTFWRSSFRKWTSNKQSL